MVPSASRRRRRSAPRPLVCTFAPVYIGTGRKRRMRISFRQRNSAFSATVVHPLLFQGSRMRNWLPALVDHGVRRTLSPGTASADGSTPALAARSAWVLRLSSTLLQTSHIGCQPTAMTRLHAVCLFETPISGSLDAHLRWTCVHGSHARFCKKRGKRKLVAVP